jgi:DNA-binding NarL/FixJ family response regulator
MKQYLKVDELVKRGLSLEDIATTLNISINNVRCCKHRMKKLREYNDKVKYKLKKK